MFLFSHIKLTICLMQVINVIAERSFAMAEKIIGFMVHKNFKSKNTRNRFIDLSLYNLLNIRRLF